MYGITYESIAQEAVKNEAWKIDPLRAMRAVKMLTDWKPGTMVMIAHRDELNNPITSEDGTWIVRSSNGGWYFVRPEDHTCTCPDHRKGNICKHRIAVYLYTQQIERTRQAVIDDVRSRKGKEQLESQLAK